MAHARRPLGQEKGRFGRSESGPTGGDDRLRNYTLLPTPSIPSENQEGEASTYGRGGQRALTVGRNRGGGCQVVCSRIGRKLICGRSF